MIGFKPACGNGITKDAARHLQRALGALKRSLSFDLADCSQNLDRRNVFDRNVPQRGFQKREEVIVFRCRGGGPARISILPPFVEEFLRNQLKRVGSVRDLLKLILLSLMAWTTSMCDNLTGSITCRTGLAEADFWVRADGEFLLLPVKAVLEPPELPPEVE